MELGRERLVNLSWTGSTDAGGSGSAGYVIGPYRRRVRPFMSMATTLSTSYNDTTVGSKVNYWYQISAFDRAGIKDQPSNVSAQPK